MQPPKTNRAHGGVRGANLSRSSLLFGGPFGRMFRAVPPADFGPDDPTSLKNLDALALAMTSVADPQDPKDGPDNEEGGIPAAYTYFGQFIDHDLTFDPASSLQKQDDPDALTDYRSPAFDLDNVYGRGPDDQPYMYDGGNGFLLGQKLEGGDRHATDLPRNEAHPHRALIGDPRNDENTIVSQLQGLFHRFHNRTLAENSSLPFSELQRLVRFHYQYVILNDFLPRIIHSSVLRDLKTGPYYDQGKLKFFHWKNGPFMPVEFSVAAYRLGHSMIRPGYRLNDGAKNLLPIFSTPESQQAGFTDDLAGFRQVVSGRAIDWGRFIDIDTRPYGDGDKKDDPNNKTRLQFAYRIDTSVVFALSNLPIPAVVAAPPPALPVRNLIRGWQMGLPSGQQVARAMGLTPMPDEKILIGKGVDKQDPTDPPIVPIDKISPVFANNCPLWTYVLAEAMNHQVKVQIPVQHPIPITTPQLGPVGGRIVAEVFLGLMFGDNHSLLGSDPTWKPKNASFELKDFVNYALGN